jgi:putative SOS response-associated peptidase YedK
LTLSRAWFERRDQRSIKSCTMLITQANGFVSQIHDRMPVILEPEQFETWPSCEAAAEILKPRPAECCNDGRFRSG